MVNEHKGGLIVDPIVKHVWKLKKFVSNMSKHAFDQIRCLSYVHASSCVQQLTVYKNMFVQVTANQAEKTVYYLASQYPFTNIKLNRVVTESVVCLYR